MKNVLVTGGAGFIGSNFIPWFMEQHPEVNLVNLDLLTYAGNLENLLDVASNPRYHFIQGNIEDRSLTDSIFSQHNIDTVFHFAAESHVDNSITGPEIFIRTNVLGTFNLLETARRHWQDAPHQTKVGKEKHRFLHVSTDEVYGALGPTGLFREDTPYAPNSPYSASKASSDFLVRAAFHTYGMNVVTTNCSNNYGPKQHDEKLLPTIIRKALTGEPIPIYGDGKNVRDWLYVMDHCRGLDMVCRTGRSGETYNIGGRNERQNIEVAQRICEILDSIRPKKKGSYLEQITYVKDRHGHDKRYAIDATKLEQEIGWQAKENFESGLKLTVEWYLEKWS